MECWSVVPPHLLPCSTMSSCCERWRSNLDVPRTSLRLSGHAIYDGGLIKDIRGSSNPAPAMSAGGVVSATPPSVVCG